MKEPLVKNASSEKQVKASGEKEKRRRSSELEDFRAVLKAVEGRRLLWRLMSHCRVFGSVHHHSGSQVYYNAGLQDVGHFLMDEIVQADHKQFFKMMEEAKDYDDV